MFSFNVFFNLFYFSLAFLSFLDFLERKSAKNFQRFAVTIKDGNSFKKQYPGKLSMTVAGASDSYHVSKGHQSGDRVIIEDNFTYVESEDEYVSNNKVLPASMEAESGLEDNIVITILENGIARLAVDTETKAKKGTRIDVVIRPTQQEAIISVDSWQIRKALIVL